MIASQERANTTQNFYSFLQGQPRNSALLDETLLESVMQKAQDSRNTQQRYIEQHGLTLVAAARAIAAAYQSGGRLLVMGNGGSSSDAAHIAVEFLHPITIGRPALDAIDLTADVGMITAVGNDLGFEDIFKRQVLAKGRKGDKLIGLSTSGNSKNLLAAFAQAKQMGIGTIALVGGNGGQMATSPDVDHCLVVETTSIHRVQESHLVTYHIMWDLVHTILAEQRGASAVAV
ncbi:MAG: SIS domain-containing protein [Leptolyngbyaceae cyanobacterium MO_188.B28]|nr:SIS domain-containing protein [Leptolyngbyaceae cyanobacterium MO_188.B28]